PNTIMRIPSNEIVIPVHKIPRIRFGAAFHISTLDSHVQCSYTPRANSGYLVDWYVNLITRYSHDCVRQRLGFCSRQSRISGRWHRPMRVGSLGVKYRSPKTVAGHLFSFTAVA